MYLCVGATIIHVLLPMCFLMGQIVLGAGLLDKMQNSQLK